jgi:hypothetical protein
MRSFMTVLYTKYNKNDEVKEDEMGKAWAESNACRILVGKPYIEWLILRWILERYSSVVWTELIWLRPGTRGRFS